MFEIELETPTIRVGSWGLAMPVPDGNGQVRPLTAILTRSCCGNVERKEEAVSRFRRLSHTLWHCQYHVVWVAKYRFRILTGAVKEAAEVGIQTICGYAGCEVLELDVQPNHVHLVVMIPPKASISDLLGRLNIALNVLRFPPIAFSGSDVTEYDVISLKIIQVWAQF